ncbi:MAG: hypothetical protein COW84_04995 [Gammaproteobacteria bacterium CG22_combo_CG10-13_8_21_14_all_40_8]|nr:MAG: hypothetical protein COW84_04995 [Gammaproteobacteria bacterium CG22_combo_CG10-13_8_21_14_all_40_8]
MESNLIENNLYPLTKQQQGLWIEWKLHPENTSYNTCVKVRLSGVVDKDRLGQALHDIVEYFDSLKIYFVEKQGVPYQCLKDEAVYFLDYKDISNNNEEESPEQRQQGLDFLSLKLNTPVDLKVFPIVRAALIKTANKTHYLIGMVPHMISDGRSAVLFLESLSVAYNHGYQGLKDAYDATKKNWRDYFNDERSKISPEAHALSQDHWKNRLANANHYFDYSYGRKKKNVDVKQGHRVYFDISAELAKALKEHTSKNRTTLFNVMVSAFSIFIYRYYGLTDILVGYPVNIRPPGYKHLFGFFVNIVPVRVDLSGNPSYQELLNRVSKVRKEDKFHQKFPAMDIVSAVRQGVKDFDGVLFNLSMAQTVSRIFNLELDGITTEPLESEYNDVNDDLSLSYELFENGIGLWFEYRTALFDKDFIEQAINHIRLILEQMTQDPQKRLNDFQLNTESELTKIFSASQNNQIAPALHRGLNKESSQSIQQLFEKQAMKKPKNAAFILDNKSISYQQLNANANQLAHQFMEQGIQPQSKIAVCLQRGERQLTTLLAILKTRSCYIPLASDYPKNRIDFIAKDTQCDLLICDNTTEELCSHLEYLEKNKTINLDELQLQSLPNTNLDLAAEETDLAYIIYTSGTTGQPKGVPIQQKNVLPRLLFLQQQIPLSHKDIMLQSTDFTFDVSVAEIFWPLISGAALALTEAKRSKDAGYILKLIHHHAVTTTCMVPSLINALVSLAKGDDLKSLKRVLSAGEALTLSLQSRFYQKCSADLYNVYGPTEATIYASLHFCDPHKNATTLPIGKPFSQTQTFVLDQQLKPQPMGVAGELYLGGVGVADGYWNRPDLTSKLFIDNPFSNQAGDKLYKTGDLVILNSDGDIEYLGRIDSQVKIRGYRIELSEIESVLKLHPQINDAAVIAQGDNDSSQRLVAYYVSKDEIEIEQLKLFLNEHIPPYMIPAFFMLLAEIPRSNSGKVNAKALPKVTNNILQLKKFTKATTETELKLANIWSSILKIPAEKISIHDSFFDLGGDSLMAIQFVCAAEEKGLYFETSSLFDKRTIADLSKVSSHEKPASIDQSHIQGEFPLTARQAKFFDDQFTNPHHWNRLFLFDVDKKISFKALQKSFDHLLMHHDALRVHFVQHQNQSWAQYCSDDLPETTYLYEHDISALSDEEQVHRMQEIINNGHKNIRLNQAPLIQGIYFITSKNTGKLAIVSHHLLLDMVSSRIIFEDLIKGYEYARRGLKIKLAKKTSSLKEWTSYLTHYAKEADFSDALNYWTNTPKHPVPNIPTEPVSDQTANSETHAHTFTFKLAENLTQKLLKDIPSRLGLKIQNILLAAFLDTLHQWTGDSEALVSICGHGRHSGQNAINLSRTVGWLNTVFPVHIKGEADDFTDIKQLAFNVHQQLEKVPSRNMDYNILRYLAQHPEICAHENPQLFFNYVGQIDAIVPDKIPFKPTMDLQGISEIDGKNHLCYLLYFEAGVIGKELNIRLTYSQKLFKKETINQLSEKLMASIESIIHKLLEK